ncbi:MAG: copper homeostasis protein CutC, partial [Bacteroidales bacterium]|nr:copper homeostasis protein CutC [Bacteroidales bacterium]
EQMVDCGCDRILTSGQCKTAYEGLENLAEMQKLANGRIKILAGSGVSPKNAVEIISKSGVGEIHASCKHIIENKQVTKLENSSCYSETNMTEVKELVVVVKNYCNNK